MENENINSRFIHQSFDKFENKSTTKFLWPAKFLNSVQLTGSSFIAFWYSDDDDWKGMEISLSMRNVKTPELDLSLIDYMYSGGDWMFLRNGKMVINIDGKKNITLECTETQTEVGFGFRNAVLEVGYYAISKNDLKEICDANEIEIKISGDNTYHIINNNPNQENSPGPILPAEKFQFMCRAFYGGLYNDATYSDLVDAIIPVGTENEVPASSGCFIATAAMGDYNHPIVMDLRLFRDNWLLKRNWGVSFTKWYYNYGPLAARFIEKSYLFRKITFYLIVKPLQLITRNLK